MVSAEEAVQASSRLSLDPHGASLAVEIAQKVEVEDAYVKEAWRVIAITAVLCAGAFLISMDRTIVAIAVPAITHHFGSATDVGWYASAYLITSCAFLPLFGRLYTFSNLKWTYFACLGVFALGSAVCGWSSSSVVLILGRAIAGLGSAGMFPGTLIIGARIVKAERRILLMGLGGLTMSIASILGPLIGGAVVARTTWRWCFLLNLPAGALLFVVGWLVMVLPEAAEGPTSWNRWMRKLRKFDLVGAVFLLSAAIALFFALHSAADGIAWSSARVLCLLVAAAILTLLLLVWVQRAKDAAIVPTRLATNPTVALACIMAVGIYGTLTIAIYYLPQYYQASSSRSAAAAAVAVLPYLVSTAVSSIAVALLASKIALQPRVAAGVLSVVGCMVATLGTSLLAALHHASAPWKIIICQILLGTGIGLSIQQSQNALQFVLTQDDLSIAMALVQFSQSLGGAISASIANAVFLTVLRASRPEAPPGTDIDELISAGIQAVRSLPAMYADSWLHAYALAFRVVFCLAAGLLGLAVAGAWIMLYMVTMSRRAKSTQ